MGPLKALVGRKAILGQKLQATDLHQLGAQQFNINWMIANMVVIDGCRAVGMEPTEFGPEAKMLMAAIAYRICAHQVETAQAAEQKGEESDGPQGELPAE